VVRRPDRTRRCGDRTRPVAAATPGGYCVWIRARGRYFGIGVADLHGRFFAHATPEFGYRCLRTSVKVCVHPAYERGLPALVQALAPVADRLRGTPAETKLLEQESWGPGAVSGADAASFYLDDLSPGYADAAAADLANGLLDVSACAETTPPPGDRCP
jgi:hypothetical protein